MTLSASRKPKHPNAPEGTRDQVTVRTTYGPVVNEVTEDVGHVRAFWSDLGRLLEEIESDR